LSFIDGAAANGKNAEAANNADSAASVEFAKDAEIRSLNKANKDQAKEITLLQEQIRKLSDEKNKSKGRLPTTTMGTKLIGNKIYHLLGSGPNSGKLLTKNWKKVHVDGKWYKEWTALSEIGLNLGNCAEMAEVKQIGGHDFYRVPDGEHQGKWMQAFTEHSFYDAPEGKFVRWVLREEIVGAADWIL
jgi:hypothetical protein